MMIIGSYPSAIRHQLLSKHSLISTMPERALNDLVKFLNGCPVRDAPRYLQARQTWRHVKPNTDLILGMLSLLAGYVGMGWAAQIAPLSAACVG